MKDNNPSGSNEQDPKAGAGEDQKRKDPEMEKKSGGPQGENNKDREQTNKANKPGRKDQENVGEGDAEPELPSKEREEKPYIGDNPEETKREAPKMK